MARVDRPGGIEVIFYWLQHLDAPMKWWKWALLIFELALFAMILILPQVDLPDFAFHRGTAPITVKARLSSTPVQPAVAGPVRMSSSDLVVEARLEPVATAATQSLDSRLSLLCTLIC
jgi:hypothetical protein